jgi:hypothetical protein
MSGRFTPGPWFTEASHEAHPRYGIFKGANVILARVWTPEDARLIAAAPELYEALRILMAAADHAGGLGGCDPELEAACRLGAAALAKARGECRDEGGVL